ncbi:50S ribosomal protein L7/L12 [Candidatus Berkelbacteria bacterium CG_4_9_14_3_um_filter_39_23]|uniref:Large ribosomal subunit protein bL12 n=2 Tax=Candidatus Berkelbacteria TaxID=1618330 RepID=A0A2M7CJ21_9BACT|nr:50S ribosomal protein L7/L12 [Candidatus Berkelbacteria bacterium]OIP05828.1 MAG: 50S ribosomal protein L7/L12 [Candidatus Berkelbacteria bacterium CG2_30_39_44]PIR28252.1 MAG: 50S ribosomal protein L7/L12 [Candidatus Berkelbacteria bacterium CG11_big_fil_rev_8_21_14_0_20_40_23]PIV25642.1 MAG: 50S ribosomal protein L7/L12 [Candidatus Berkelbacteria bacterium CG03_land_8_20_14_0_80_40_36]PIX30804.1 MAG: 50S ribosomal protein L7/L12 [Candidatus Berkelbacteria bacterium CG_4_8_14_3_um_filter_39
MSDDKKVEKKEFQKAVSGAFAEIVEKLEKLTVKELADLVKDLEDRWGVSSVPMAATGAVAQTGEIAQVDEKSEFTIHLVDAGSQKIAVIKAVREVRPDLGLKEAKDLVDGAPKEVKANVPKAEAEEAKKKLETAGAKVELK